MYFLVNPESGQVHIYLVHLRSLKYIPLTDTQIFSKVYSLLILMNKTIPETTLAMF